MIQDAMDASPTCCSSFFKVVALTRLPFQLFFVISSRHLCRAYFHGGSPVVDRERHAARIFLRVAHKTGPVVSPAGAGTLYQVHVKAYMLEQLRTIRLLRLPMND